MGQPPVQGKKYNDNIFDKIFKFILIIDFSQRLSYEKYLKEPKISKRVFLLKMAKFLTIAIVSFFIFIPLGGLFLFCFMLAFIYLRFCIYVAKLVNTINVKPSNFVVLSLFTLHISSLYVALSNINKQTMDLANHV